MAAGRRWRSLSIYFIQNQNPKSFKHDFTGFNDSLCIRHLYLSHNMFHNMFTDISSIKIPWFVQILEGQSDWSIGAVWVLNPQLHVLMSGGAL